MVETGFSLTQTTQPLHAGAYFDNALYEREKQLLFQNKARYLGHALNTPAVGDFYALPQENEGRVLLRTPQGISLMSNVCRHRQAIMLKGKGNTGTLLGQTPGTAPIVCPLHRWTYNTQGELIAAPQFPQLPTCSHLQNHPLSTWNGLLFEDPQGQAAEHLGALSMANEFDFSGYVLGKTQIHECHYNWKTFIEVYLEDYHVAPFHPGLGHFVSCDNLRWEFHPECSAQIVDISQQFNHPATPAYQQWHTALLKYNQGVQPSKGAIWLTLYPNLMLEWYPHVLVVSSLFPRGPQHTTNVVEFFYPEEIAAFEPEFMQAQQAAYMETCVEDDEIALRMDAGRQALVDRGVSETGPYQSPLEDGMAHFHDWYRRHMEL